MESLARIVNLADGPRDYPLKSGESIYLEPKGKHTPSICIPPDEISEVLLKAEKKGLLRIEQVPVSVDKKNAKAEKNEKEAEK